MKIWYNILQAHLYSFWIGELCDPALPPLHIALKARKCSVGLHLPEYSNILSSKSGNGEKICWFQMKNKIIIPTYVLMWFLFSPSPCAVNASLLFHVYNSIHGNGWMGERDWVKSEIEPVCKPPQEVEFAKNLQSLWICLDFLPFQSLSRSIEIMK